MNQLKATPGVWKQATGIGYCCIRTGSMNDKTGGVIADMRLVDGVYNPFDACLIAAAPELYESNQELARHVVELCAVMGVPVPADSLERHRAASAKARGETP